MYNYRYYIVYAKKKKKKKKKKKCKGTDQTVWSIASLSFAYDINRFSFDVAQIKLTDCLEEALRPREFYSRKVSNKIHC